MINIIMIEDDQGIASLLKEYLVKFNMNLVNYDNPAEGIDAITKGSFDILILDLMLPEMDGLEVCKKVSEISNIPIIISSARSDDSDIVSGLEIGADDYVRKPYNPRELVARIKSILRRTNPEKEKSLKNSVKGLELDEEGMTVKKDGKVLDLTSAEYELLSMLMRNNGKVLTRDYILENSKTMNLESIDRSVDVIIGRLRKKIGDDIQNPRFIRSVRGYGYKFFY